MYTLDSNGVRPSHRYLFKEGIKMTKSKTVLQKKYWVCTLRTSADYQTYVEENMYVGIRTLMQRWARPPD